MNTNYNLLNTRLGSLFSGKENGDGHSSGFFRWCNFLIVTAVMFFASFTFAQTVTIGSGTSTQIYPLGNYYGYERSASIYTAAEIATTGSINKLAWYANTASTVVRPIKIYLKATTSSTLTASTWASQISGATLVYDSSVIIAVGWNDFILSSVFAYGGGTDNLLVLVEANYGGTGGTPAAGSSIRYSSATSKHMYVRADTTAPTGAGTVTNFRPNIQVSFPSLTPPNCAISQNPADGAIGVARNSVLTWADGGGGPTSYDIYLQTGVTPPSYQNVIGTTYTNPTLFDANATYNWLVIPKNANGEAIGCVEYSFTTGTELEYCAVSTTNTSDYTSAFSTTGATSNISYSASSQPSGSYSDQTSQSFSVAQGQSFDFSHSYVGGSNGIKIWIDYNENGAFDVSEEVYYLASTSATKTGTVTVPLATPIGQYRMRVRSQFGSTAVPPACGSVSYGSTVDFALNVVTAPSCFFPTALSASNVTSASADLAWVAPLTPPANGYQWAVTTFATPPASGTATANLTASASSLSSGTLHYLHVRSVCGVSEFSDWASISFTTLPSCGNTFYDNGGVSGDYSNDLDTTTTIYPTTPGDGVIVTFTAFGTEACCDNLKIYDGPDATYPLIGTFAGTTSPGTVTATDASGALTFVFHSDTSLVGLGWAADITCFTFPTDTPDWVNLQWPYSATILAGNSETIYARVYEGGLTDTTSGQAAGIEAWIGISPIGSDSNPNSWSTWIPATFNVEVGNNDEYQANIGSTLPVGTYYYASRFRLNGGPFVYGGTNDYFWNGTGNNSGVLTVNANPTQCAVIGAPANAATNVTIGTVALSWTAPTSGPAPTGYKVYFGTTSGSLTLMTTTNASTFTYNASAPTYSTTYYWSVVPTSVIGGGDAVGCAEWSFTTEADPFAPYCSGITFTSAVEPITLVNFAGINNATGATVGGTPAHQNFIAISGNVTTESTYAITLKGNSDGDYTNNFRVFIDWNQDGDFGDSGETFNAGSITNSTGLDAIQAVTNITIPGSALAGPTRMRVKKLFGTTSIDNPCLGGGFGQVEDYTLMVTLCTPLNWYADNDGDTYGDNSTLVSACSSPGANYVLVGGDCNDNNIAINPGATEICYDGIDQNCDGNFMNSCAVITARLRAENCDTNLTSLNQVVRGNRFSQSIPSGVTVTGYRFRVTNLLTNEVRIVDRSNYVFQLTYTDFADYNTPYSVEVALRLNQEWMEAYGAPCTITTPGVPNTVLAPASCGATVAQMNNIIRAVVVPSATSYEFEVSLIEGAVAVETTTLIKTGESFNLLQLTGISIKYGAEYSVRVKVQVPTSSGPQWSTEYGAACSVFTPLAAEAAIEGCGVETGIAPAAMTTLIYASPVGGATQYKFTLTDGMAYTQTYTTPSRYFKLSNFNALQALTPGGTYSVTVEVQIYGFYYPGKDCNILVPGGAPIVPFTREVVSTDNPMGEFKAVAYPNPFENSFAIDLRTSSTTPVTLAIYDMTGRLLDTKEIKAEGLSTQTIGERYPSGVYNVIVTQGENTQTVRVVKK